LLILCANLKKALRQDRIDSEIVTFARRVGEIVPFTPDAVLLQEVVADTAARGAALLRRTTQADFDVAVGPGPEPVVGERGGQIVVRNTAILLNRATMRRVGDGGFVASRYLSRDASSEFRPRIKEHAHCLARTASGKIDVPLISIHFVTNEKFAASTMGFCYKAQWVRRVTSFMATQYPPGDAPQLPVIGGDFNHRRCVKRRERPDCEVFPFWYALTAQHSFTDAVFARHGASAESLAAQAKEGKRIDYVFVRAEVIDASHDVGYAARRGERGFYSDHRLLWALVEPH
jgi:exonuclease III